MSALAPTLQAFFTERLIRERQVSPNTIAAYRDTLRLLLGFAAKRTGKRAEPPGRQRPRRPADRRVPRPPRAERGNGVAHSQRPTGGDPLTVSLRRAAPPRARPGDQRVLAIPPKRFQRDLVTFLDRGGDRRAARRAGPLDLDRPSRPGDADARRSRPGCAPSELTGLTCADVHLGNGPHVSCLGRGESRGSRRSPAPRPRSCASGSPNAGARPTSRSSRPAAAVGSAATAWSAGSPTTRRAPPHAARR